MSTRQIAITGIDGSGKTTLIRMLRAKYANDPQFVQVFRAPQYHENTDAPFHELSHTVNAMSTLGDEWNDPCFKISSLFIAITLYGSIQDFFERTYQPKFLFTERQPVVDTFAYTAFYQRLLKKPLDQKILEPKIIAKIGQAKFDSVHRWMKILEGRQISKTESVSFWNLPKLILDLVDQEPAKMVEDLKRIYASPLPNLLIVLQVNEASLEKRFQERALQNGATPELHEKKHILSALNEGLLRGTKSVQAIESHLEVKLLDSSTLTLDETLIEIEKLAGLR